MKFKKLYEEVREMYYLKVDWTPRGIFKEPDEYPYWDDRGNQLWIDCHTSIIHRPYTAENYNNDVNISRHNTYSYASPEEIALFKLHKL